MIVEYTTVLVYANPHLREIVEVRRRHNVRRPFVGVNTERERMLEALEGQGCPVLGEWRYEPSSNSYRVAEVGRFLLKNPGYRVPQREYLDWVRGKAAQLVAREMERAAKPVGRDRRS